MTDAQDMDLVQEFARHNSEAAFTELVRRHIALVYSVARRCTGNDGDAQDVTQAVFIILTRKAAGLRERTLLPGWLYETTRFTAARLQRNNIRRQQREQEAYMQSTLNEADTADVWERLSPHLEDGMSKLAERDRALLVLRFYQNKSGPEAAALLGIREGAAHMRMTRAIEKLRKFFARRGVTLSGEKIVGAISANSVQAVPVALAKSVTAVALAKGAVASGSTLTLIKGALKIMAWTKEKTAIVSAVVVGMATSSVIQHQAQVKLREQNETLQQQQAPLAEQIEQLQKERDDATNRLADLLAENSRLKSNPHETELLKLRGQIGVLRQQSEKLAQAFQSAEKQNHPTFPSNFVSRDSLEFAGYDTPEDLLKSVLWSKSVGNVKACWDAAAPEMTNLLNNYIQGNTDEERSQFLIDKAKNLVGYKILSETPVAPDEVLVQMEYDWQGNGQTGNSVSMLVMKQIGGQWKMYDDYENSDQVIKSINSLTGANSANADTTNTVRVIGQ